MITKLVPIKDEVNTIVGYREVASAESASNMAVMVVYTYPIKSTPLVYSYKEYNELPDLSALENNDVVHDAERSAYWLVK